MGDVADLILDGTLCQGCGVYIEGPASGVPRQCDSCREMDIRAGAAAELERAHSAGVKMTCPFCYRRVKAVGFSDHYRQVHLRNE